MVMLPSAKDVPKARIPSDPGVRNAGQIAQPTGLEDLGIGLQNFAKGQSDILEARARTDARLAAAAKRIDEANNGIDRDRIATLFEENLNERRAELTRGPNIAQQSLLDAEGVRVEQTKEQFLSEHIGDEISKLKLRNMLDRLAVSHTDRLVTASTAARKAQLDASFGRKLNAIAQKSLRNRQNPISEAFDEWDVAIDDLGLTGTAARVKRAEGREDIAKAQISTAIGRGDLDGAEDMMNDPILFDVLQPSSRAELRNRIAGKRKDKKNLSVIPGEELVNLGLPVVPGAIVQVARDDNGEVVNTVFRYKPTNDQNARDKRIADADKGLESLGVSDPEQRRNMATALIDNQARVDQNQTSGKTLFIDERAAAATALGAGGDNPSVIELNVGGGITEGRAEIPPNQTLVQMADNATGLRAKFLSVTARIPGTDPSESESAVLNARSTFNIFANDLARGLVNNPRFPVGERSAVLDALDVSPSVFDSGGAMRVRLIAAARFMAVRRDQFLRDANDRELDSKTRSGQKANASAMQNAIDRIGTDENGRISIDSETLKFFTAGEVGFLARQMSEEEWNALDDEIKSEVGVILGVTDG